MTIQISITNTDIDALSRLIATESGTLYNSYINRGYSSEEAAKYAFGSVIDVVINRAASNSTLVFGGTTIQGVINKENQFDAIGSGGWQALAPASSEIQSAVRNYVLGRMSGANSVIGDATNYLNPTVLGSVYDKNGNGVNDGWEDWGEDITNPIYIGSNPFNDDGTLKNNVNTHVFGKATNLNPEQYTLSFDLNGDGVIGVGETFTFDPTPIPPIPGHKPNVISIDLTSPLLTPSDRSIGEYLLSVLQQIATAMFQASPLVLDLDGDGIELTSLTGNNSVYWDIDQDGSAEASGWVGADDGLLVRDINGNGSIDNHSELFGNATTDGFTILTVLDSNSDGVINANDTNFSTLKIWQDLNQDGVSQVGELFTRIKSQTTNDNNECTARELFYTVAA